MRPIIDHGKRDRAGLRVATTLAESAANSFVAKRRVKKATNALESVDAQSQYFLRQDDDEQGQHDGYR
jgi:hypothetical protein